MSWTPTDEQVERTANAAASAENEHFEVCGDTHSVYEHIADAVLVAVGPHIAREAAEEAWDELYATAYSDAGYSISGDPNNPYRQEAGRG